MDNQFNATNKGFPMFLSKLEKVSTSSLIHADFLVTDEWAHSSINYRKYPFCLSQASMDESVNQINILMCEGSSFLSKKIFRAV